VVQKSVQLVVDQDRIAPIRADVFESFEKIRVIRGKETIRHVSIPPKTGVPFFVFP